MLVVGVPRRSYQRRLARLRAGDPLKGPWPAPVVDRIEPVAAKYAQAWPAWGYRKIHAMAAADGVDIGSASSVRRAMARRDLLQPVRRQAERRLIAAGRRQAFAEPPGRRNRVWQADFTEFETAGQGTWRIAAVLDYHTKLALACTVTTTSTAADLIAALQAAVDTAEALLGRSLAEDCADPDTGEITPLTIVTDNGPAMKSHALARWIDARPQLAHVRTRNRSPHTNGVVERWFQTLKYDHLYRHDIPSGIDLAAHAAEFTDQYNTIRPHEHLGQQPPIQAHLHPPTRKQNPPETEPKT